MKERWTDLNGDLQSNLLTAFLKHVAYIGDGRLANSQFFSNAVWSFSVMGLPWCPTAESRFNCDRDSSRASEEVALLWTAVKSCLPRLLRSSDGIFIATIVNSLTKLEYFYGDLDPSVAQALEAAVISAGAGLSPREIATVVYGFGKMGNNRRETLFD